MQSQADGSARVSARSVGAIGTYVVTATAAGQTVEFPLYNRSGTPASIATLTQTPQQDVAPLAPVPVAPRVVVLTAGGLPVQFTLVQFASTQGGGSVTGSLVATDANGEAQVGGWFMGPAYETEHVLTALADTASTSFLAVTQAGPMFADGFE
jgi:hypothetical protein